MVQEYEREINLIILAKVIKRKIAIVLAVGIGFASVFGIYSYSTHQDIYMATATLYIETNAVEGTIPNSTESVPMDYIELIRSKAVLENVISATNSEIEYEDLLSMLSITNTDRTHVLNVSISSENAEEAAVLANTISLAAVELLNEISNIYQLKSIGNASVPTSPIGNNNEGIVIAFLLGAFVAVAAILGCFILKDGVASREEAENCFKTIVLGEVLTTKRNKKTCCESTFKYICSNTTSIIGSLNCVLVSGVTENERPNEICNGMGQSLMDLGKTVAYVDLEFNSVEKYCEKIDKVRKNILNLKKENDVVIITSPSIEENAAILDIVDYCDGAVLIVEKNITNRNAVNHAIKQLEIMRCKLIGIVLTTK